MAHVRAWRNFKRMQSSACLFASLIYAAAVLYAWRVLPDPAGTKVVFTLVFPLIYLAAAFLAAVWIGPVRRWLKHYVWLSFAAGFGQTPISVIVGLGLIAGVAAFIYWQINGVAAGGRYPAGAFAAYGAGVGVLFAQAVMVRLLEREPKIRAIIET